MEKKNEWEKRETLWNISSKIEEIMPQLIIIRLDSKTE